MRRLIGRIMILVFAIAVMVAGVVGCGKPAPDITTDTSYKLTHSAADAEYILSWDTIVARMSGFLSRHLSLGMVYLTQTSAYPYQYRWDQQATVYYHALAGG